MFFASLITPVILLVLYAAFLANVYRDSFISALPEGFPAAEKLIGGIVGEAVGFIPACGKLHHGIILLQHDHGFGQGHGCKTGSHRFPSKSTLALSYYLATLLQRCLSALLRQVRDLSISAKGRLVSFLCRRDAAVCGHCSACAFRHCTSSSIVNPFSDDSGAGSAVGTIVASGYGFICGAYMPIAHQLRLAAHPYVSARNIRNKPSFAIMPSAVRSPRQRCGSCSRSY